jgi:hypothetical protein
MLLPVHGNGSPFLQFMFPMNNGRLPVFGVFCAVDWRNLAKGIPAIVGFHPLDHLYWKGKFRCPWLFRLTIGKIEFGGGRVKDSRLGAKIVPAPMRPCKFSAYHIRGVGNCMI